jgi:hypothetical protein
VFQVGVTPYLTDDAIRNFFVVGFNEVDQLAGKHT